MNKVILMGRFTKDPESRMSSNGTKVAIFGLACNYGVDKDGNSLVEFINCKAFGKTAELISTYCHKGDGVLAEGKIRNGSYDAQDGTKRYTTDIIIDRIEFAGKSGNASQSQQVQQAPAYQPVQPPVQPAPVQQSNPYKEFGNEYTLNSDDLPF